MAEQEPFDHTAIDPHEVVDEGYPPEGFDPQPDLRPDQNGGMQIRPPDEIEDAEAEIDTVFDEEDEADDDDDNSVDDPNDEESS